METSDTSLLLFTTAFPRGHAETYVATELPYLAERFASVTVVPLWAEPGEPRPVPANVRIAPPLFAARYRRLALLRSGAAARAPVLPLLRGGPWGSAHPTLNKVARYGYTALLVRSLLARPEIRAQLTPGHGFDAAYFYWATGAVTMVPFLERRIPCVARFHRNDLYEDLWDGYLPFRRQLVASLDHLIFVSQDGQEYVNARYPGSAARSRLFRLGTPDHGRAPPVEGDRYRLLSCSHAVPVKRLHLLAEALRHLDFPIEWTHLGAGPELERIRAMAARLPANVAVRLLGHVPHAQVMEHFRRHGADLFVNVSASEGLPVSIMEALSFGVPVLATNVGGAAELVSPPFGQLVPPGVSDRELARRITEFRSAPRAPQRDAARDAWARLASAERNFAAFADFMRRVAAGEPES